MSPWPNKQPNLICLCNILRKLELLLYRVWKINHDCLCVHHNQGQISCVAHCLFFFLPLVPWRSEGGKLWVAGSWESCAYNGVSGLCQSARLKFSSSGLILSSQWHRRSLAMETGSEANGGAEGPLPGLNCTECSDKTTGKGRLGELAGATVTPGSAHSSLRSPVEVRARSSHAVPGARSWTQCKQMYSRVPSTATVYNHLLYWCFYIYHGWQPFF